MKRTTAILTLIPALLLSSCGEKITFEFTDNPDYIYLTRNGDNYKSTSNDLDTFIRSSNAKEIVARINSGEAIFLYAYQFGCGACGSVREALTAFLRDSNATCYGLYDNEEVRGTDKSVIKAGFDALKKNFPAFKDVIGDEYRTPTAYLIKDKEHIVNVTFDKAYEGQKEDPIVFEKKYKDLANYTSIYEFHNAEKFLSYASENDCFFILDDYSTSAKGTFMTKVYERAKHVNKPVARVVYSALSTADQQLLASRFGNGSSNLYGTFEKGMYTTWKYSDEAGFAEYLDGYFGKDPNAATSSSQNSDASSSGKASAESSAS